MGHNELHKRDDNQDFGFGTIVNTSSFVITSRAFFVLEVIHIDGKI